MKRTLNTRLLPPTSGEFLLDDREVAQKTGISRSSWQKDRLTGRSGLPFVKIGRLVRYRLSDVSRGSWHSRAANRLRMKDARHELNTYPR